MTSVRVKRRKGRRGGQRIVRERERRKDSSTEGEKWWRMVETERAKERKERKRKENRKKETIKRFLLLEEEIVWTDPVRFERNFISWRPVWSRAQLYTSTVWPFSAARLARAS